METLTVVYQQALEELYLRVISTISDLKNETEDAMFQHKSFQEFSKYISQLNTVIIEMEQRRIETPLLESLDSLLKRSYKIIKDYKSSSPFLQFLNSHDVLSQMQTLTKEIATTVKILGSTSLESTLDLKSKTNQIFNDLESLEFESAVKTEAIIDEIEKSTSESCKNRVQSMNLMMKIAESVGVTVNPSQLQEELTLLKQEMEALEAKKKMAEALQVSQLIQLLDSCRQQQQQRISSKRGSMNQQSAITSFTCPLCDRIMEDPVAISCGHSFERRAIQERFDGGDKTCPTCREVISFPDLTPNYSLKNSIEEWKQRNLDFKFQNAVTGIASDDPNLLNQALEDLQVVMENPNYTERVAAQHGLIPRIVQSLRITSVNGKAAIKCLCYLAKQSDENKEAIANAGTVRQIVKRFCKGETDLDALEVLLELSKNEAVADKIGEDKDCIPILVSFFNNHNFNNDVSQMAQKVLQNLSSNTHFVIKMAEVGHFQPFIVRFSKGPLETKASMASALVKMQLNDYNNKEFERKKFIRALTQMLSSSSPASKYACLQCMKKLLAFPKMAKRFLDEQTTIPGLLGLIAFPGTETHLKQAAAEVLTALVAATQPSDAEENSHLQELQTEHNIGLCLNLAASSEAPTKSHFLKLLLTIAQKSEKARSVIRSNNSAMADLFVSLDPAQTGSVRQPALKLISCIAEDNPTGVELPASPTDKESAVKALVTILTCSMEIDERSMAAGIIGQLPANDATVDEIICKSEALKAIRQVICDLEDGRPSSVGGHAGDSGSLLENALAALLRYTKPNKPELTRQLSKLELYPSLVRVLSTGTSLAKERSAIALAHLSVSPALSPTRQGLAMRGAGQWTFIPTLQLRQLSLNWCCTARRPVLCLVHGDECSSSHFFCLVKANAVGPLVRALSETNTRVAEAALSALDTLFNDEGTWADAAKAINRCHGVPAILNVLEKGDTSAREKALDLFDKILSSSQIEKPQLQRSHKILIQLIHDDVFKKKAALVLGKQGGIVQQSSYF